MCFLKPTQNSKHESMAIGYDRHSFCVGYNKF